MAGVDWSARIPITKLKLGNVILGDRLIISNLPLPQIFGDRLIIRNSHLLKSVPYINVHQNIIQESHETITHPGNRPQLLPRDIAHR